MRRFILLAAAMLMTSASAASAATISFTAPSVVSGTFDVVVQAENVFGGRDELTDAVIGYGFDVAVSNRSSSPFWAPRRAHCSIRRRLSRAPMSSAQRVALPSSRQ